MKFKVLIVEDEVLISEHIKRVVEKSGFRPLDICEDYEEAMKLLQYETPDLAFLDIRMNGVDEGVEVAKHLRTLNIPFVFITSFSDKETLQNAVMQQPLGYILKPFTNTEIQEYLAVLEKAVIGGEITVGNVNNKERISIDEIMWVKSENVYVELHCTEKKHVHRSKLTTIHEMLPTNQFVRTSQSHIVNLNYVKSISSEFITLENETIPLSKKYKKVVFEKFGEL